MCDDETRWDREPETGQLGQTLRLTAVPVVGDLVEFNGRGVHLSAQRVDDLGQRFHRDRPGLIETDPVETPSTRSRMCAATSAGVPQAAIVCSISSSISEAISCQRPCLDMAFSSGCRLPSRAHPVPADRRGWNRRTPGASVSTCGPHRPKR